MTVTTNAKSAIVAAIVAVLLSSGAAMAQTPPAAATPPAGARPATTAPATTPTATAPALPRPAGAVGGTNTADDRIDFTPGVIAAIQQQITVRHQACIAKGGHWSPPHAPGEVSPKTGRAYKTFSTGSCKAASVKLDNLPEALKAQVRAYVKQ